MADTGDANREVAIAYTVKGDAEQKAAGLARAFEGVHRAADAAKTRVNEVGRSFVVGALGAAGLTLGLREMWEHSKEVNLSMEAMQKRIAGATFAFSTWTKGTTGLEKWTESMKDGVEITEKLEGVSRRHKVSREELAGIYAGQAQMNERYRQSQAQQIDLTEKLAATQNVLGISAESAGQIIARAALTGSIPVRTELGRALAGSIGNLKTFRHLSEEVRFEKLKKAMGDLVPASQEMGKGMKGALFDIHEAGTEILRDLTKPMFGEQTKALRDWAANLTKIREDGKSISHEYGEKIAKAFTTIKDVSGAIAEHWKLIAGIFVAGKVAGGLRGMAGFFGGAGVGTPGAGGMTGVMNVQAGTVNVGGGPATALGATTATKIAEGMKPGLTASVSGLLGFASKLTTAAAAGAALYLGAKEFADWVEKKKSEEVATSQKLDMNTLGTLSGRALEQYLQMGGLGKAGENKKAVTEAFAAMSTKDREAWSSRLGLKEVIRDAIPGIGGSMANAGYGSIVANTNPEALATAFGESVANALMHASPLFGKGLGVLNESGFNMLAGIDEKTHKDMANHKGDHITNIGVVNLTQDFKADDPERIFHRARREMVRELNQIGNSPDHSIAARNG